MAFPLPYFLFICFLFLITMTLSCKRYTISSSIDLRVVNIENGLSYIVHFKIIDVCNGTELTKYVTWSQVHFEPPAEVIKSHCFIGAEVIKSHINVTFSVAFIMRQSNHYFIRNVCQLIESIMLPSLTALFWQYIFPSLPTNGV